MEGQPLPHTSTPLAGFPSVDITTDFGDLFTKQETRPEEEEDNKDKDLVALQLSNLLDVIGIPKVLSPIPPTPQPPVQNPLPPPPSVPLPTSQPGIPTPPPPVQNHPPAPALPATSPSAIPTQPPPVQIPASPPKPTSRQQPEDNSYEMILGLNNPQQLLWWTTVVYWNKT